MAANNSLLSALSRITAHHKLDLDYTTIRKGSPHTLSCVKNEKSHQRDLARRAEDEKLLHKITTI